MGKTYRPNIINAINLLLEAYEIIQSFNRVKLTYIDAFDFRPTVADALPISYRKLINFC